MSDNSFSGINFDDKESKKIFDIHSKTMCPLYKNLNENSFVINLKIKNNNINNSFIISGNVLGHTNSEIFIKYSASNPPTYNSNFSGSGLPFPNETIAFENTPNMGVIEVINGKFSFAIRYPNSYYINLGSVYIPPQVRLMLVDKNNKQMESIKTVNLGEGIPFRTLTWPIQRDWNKGALFYKNNDLPVRTQYQILLDSSYPSTNKIPENFWGLKPSM
jgi:hypothetical protein